MKPSEHLRKLAAKITESVKIKESLGVEEAMETAEKMLGELVTCPEGTQEIVPGVFLEFCNGLEPPNLLSPDTVTLEKDGEKWRLEKGESWVQISE